jgi:hypothetical protein
VTTHPASVDKTQGGRSRFPTLAALVLLSGALGSAAALQVMNGSLVAALCLVPYVAVLCAVWWFTRGNLLVLVLVAYLLAPAPADNLLPQVFIFAGTDYALRPRDLVFLADIVLLVALLLVRPPLPPGRLARAWLVSLLVLAAYPVLVGLFLGVGQSVPALIQGAMMPLRGVGVVLLAAWWARTRGWDAAVRDLGRTVVLCGAAIAVAEVVLLMLAHGELNFSMFGYPLVVDGRPSVPGWGNNILANFLCTCLAVLTFLRHRLGWRLRWVAPLGLLLFVGLAYTEVRIGMVVALVIVETPIVLAVIRKLWPRRGAIVAVLAGAVFGVVLAVATVTVLYAMNPRFNTLTPSFIEKYVGSGGGAEAAPETSIDPETGLDQGGASISTRGALFKAALEVWERNPVIGTGWNGWGWAKSTGEYAQVVGVDPHNGFTWLLADAGVLGVLLLYLLPVVLALRRWDLWWLLAVPGVATMLEMVNPNLRNGHFAVIVWAFLAIAFVAVPPARRYTLGQWFRDAWDWVRGRETAPAPAVPEAPRLAAVSADRAPALDAQPDPGVGASTR